MKRLCPECGEISEWEEITRTEVFQVRGEEIEVPLNIERCPKCGTEFENLNNVSDPYQLAYNEYRRRKGMVFPSQISDFRKKYGLTQKELSGLLGFGDITLSRYENGALQDEAHDQLLKFVLDPMNLLKLVKQKIGTLSDEKRDTLVSVLEKERTIDFISNEILTGNFSGNLTGNRDFNFNKFINLIKFFTYEKPVYKSKLMKLLFYADFKSFKETNQSITGLKYTHLPFGPVPDKYGFLLASLLEVDHSILIDQMPADNPIGEVIISTEPYSTDILSTKEEVFVREVHNRFSNYSAKEIEDFSHKEKGYKETHNGEIIAYSYASDLQI